MGERCFVAEAMCGWIFAGKGGEPERYEGELVRLVLVEGGVVR